MPLREGEVIYSPGQTLIRQGELNHAVFYWSGGGTVRILIDDRPVRELNYDPAETHFFGDISAILGCPATSTVESSTPNRFIPIRFEPEAMSRTIQRSPDLARRWLESLADTAHGALTLVHERELDLTVARTEYEEKNAAALEIRRRWSGGVSLARRLAEQLSSPVLAGLAGYYENLKILEGAEGDATPDFDEIEQAFAQIIQNSRKHS